MSSWQKCREKLEADEGRETNQKAVAFLHPSQRHLRPEWRMYLMKIKFIKSMWTGATFWNGFSNKMWLCFIEEPFEMIYVLQIESWGPERGWGKTQRVTAPEFESITWPLLSHSFSSLPDNPSWVLQLGPHHITGRSLLGDATISLSSVSSWSISQHMDKIQSSRKAGERKHLTMNKRLGKTPNNFPNELKQSKSSRSSCFTARADCLRRIRWWGKAGW